MTQGGTGAGRVPRVGDRPPDGSALRAVPSAVPDATAEADRLLRAVGRGDEAAFERLYGIVAPRVYGLVRRVLRDPAQAEEVTQEALVEVWRTAGRFDPTRGSATGWVFTIAHRRAVDRVRSEESRAERTRRVAAGSAQTPYDEVAEEAAVRLERQQVRRCLGALTEVQREAITLAYYGGHTYREVATLLEAALPTVKTRMRDGLIRLRDCLGVELGR
ncbi:ECF RNA polymerase sigma factor SigK [Micromonospora sp. WMMD882]|uniref:ECF RNA polymerase sigma factor SigK n=1 Tax=Micromonospora sp. WMMD882 TaxID=3015151 RepID=UPI00248C4522|nr:ECF RNA polymerase sigma factor SigK [Micromonospora sp. WMMD882]WBB79440.1 ECF RNA polymerase sigma factor SigK [Micromonospora sp. WMMD882]